MLATADEQGLADFEAGTWYAVFLPKGTPAAIVQKLHDAVTATMNAADVQAKLAELGIETKYIDVGQPKQLPVVLSGLHGATVVYSIPPAGQMTPGAAVRVSMQAAYGAGANCFIYFSSCGLYGSAPDDDIWVDEIQFTGCP